MGPMDVEKEQDTSKGLKHVGYFICDDPHKAKDYPKHENLLALVVIVGLNENLESNDPMQISP